MNVAVIGAGVTGRCVALALMDRGIPFKLFEARSSQDMTSASAIAAGMLAPFSEQEFVSSELLPQAIEGLKLWEEWEDKFQLGVVKNGSLVLSFSQEDAAFERLYEILKGHGFNKLTKSELKSLEPGLPEKAVQGLHFPQEGRVESSGFYQRTNKLLKEQLSFNQAISSEIISSKDYDCTIDCTGMRARKTLKNLRGVRGEIIRVCAPEIHLQKTIRLMHARHPLYTVPLKKGMYALGASVIESEDDSPISVQSALEFLSGAYYFDPAFLEARIIAMSTSLRPAFADNMPRVVKKDGILYVNGLYRHGYLLGPYFAQQALREIL